MPTAERTQGIKDVYCHTHRKTRRKICLYQYVFMKRAMKAYDGDSVSVCLVKEKHALLMWHVNLQL